MNDQEKLDLLLAIISNKKLNNIFNYLGIDLFAISVMDNPEVIKSKYSRCDSNTQATYELIKYYQKTKFNTIDVYTHCLLSESSQTFILYNVDKLINYVGNLGIINMLTAINENANKKISDNMDTRLKNRLISLGSTCEKNNVKIYSIGKGYKDFYSVYNDDLFRTIIKKIRNVYSGKITYSASIEEASRITWWDECDFIGINFFTKIIDNNNADEDEIFGGYFTESEINNQNISPHEFLYNLHKKYNKPIYITEFGVRMGTSSYGQQDNMVNDNDKDWAEIQYSAYKAFFKFVSKCDFIIGANLYGDCIDYENWNDMKIRGNLKIEKLIEQTSTFLL